MTPRPGWIKRISGAIALWAGICGVGFLAGMSPRPMLLAGLTGALSVAFWLASDSLSMAEATTWQVTEELINRPRGGDARVATLEHVIADSRTSAESRLRLHHLLSALADERLLSLRGIDRRADPSGARAALGPELDDFITGPNPGHTALSSARMSLLLNRIESL